MAMRLMTDCVAKVINKGEEACGVRSGSRVC
jgi:hypothetical protein